ncbi:hypothetical protein [Paenibacillus elgii]|uniref:hypothetical protein n=1 Tax=Paenibacillus elgii TaxID=189691 RepID=UPI002041818A|nr:hypothetical protein [Paenibacillus elgii]MCM3274156.1 hypothetical protein [Paenibacillus elgii]
MENNTQKSKEQLQEEARIQFYGAVRNNNPYSLTDNSIAQAIKIIAIAEIILGIILGIIFANQEDATSLRHETAFRWSVAITWWIATLVSGFLLLGFSEIIRLLHEINEKNNLKN